MPEVMTQLGQLTTTQLRALLDAGTPVVALVPVGSVEPHGPHLPLLTDVVISQGACTRAVPRLATRGVTALVAPAVPYGVTDCAAGFAGAVSMPAAALTAWLGAVADALLAAGFAHVCLVNNHLEPAQDAAVRAAATPRARKVSVACPLTRRWARTLSDEFKRGECHAGRYETSLVLAEAPAWIDEAVRRALPDVPISLAQGLAAGMTTFAAMGMHDAYAGAPAAATAAEGEAQYAQLAEMITIEVCEALGR